MGDKFGGRVPEYLRLRDLTPTVLSLTASVVFAAILIILNSGGQTVASAASAVTTEAERVDARAVGVPRPGRLAVSPSVTNESVELATAEIASQIVVAGGVVGQVGQVDQVESEVLSAVEQIEGGEDPTEGGEGVPVGEAETTTISPDEDESGEDDADEDVAITTTRLPTTAPTTTTSISPAVQPSAATTTQAPTISSSTPRSNEANAELVPSTRNIFRPGTIAPSTTERPRVTTRAPRAEPTRTRPTTTVRPTTTTTTTTTSTTTTTTTTTTQPPVPQFISGNFTVAQVIDGTIGAGDGSNPNEEAPMGRHEASLFLPQTWNWAQGTTRNAQWGNLRSDQFAEFRCAVIPENGHVPPVDFRVNFTEGAYYQFANGSWSKAFDVALDSPSHGAYLGIAGQVNTDPFASGQGAINWRREADGSYSAPWNPAALMMHFWASERQSPAAGQTAEFLSSQMRLQQPDGRTVDLSQVRVLFQCGIDYYDTTGGQGTQVPGPGIAKYQRLTPSWQPGLWVTLPGNVSASNPADFRNWLEANLPPDVRP